MKKALIIFASPHQNGSTFKVLNFLKEKIKSEFNFYAINAFERNPKACIDCGKCKESGECVFYDLEDLDYYLSVCDLVIFASPVYNYSFPAPFKSIIDRTQRYYNSKKIMNVYPFEKKPKKGIIILAAGSEKFKENIISAQIEPILRLLNIIDINYIILKNTDDKKLNIDNFLSKSENNIKGIVDSLN